jgi:diaminohydroxyphosphoribosylaminopyrimidine deaminase / 5-amino-6-(5-phosphoribosylamino)uracil reductase
MTDHQRYMRTALLLAQRHLGCTWPNPSVGAVIVKNNQIIATGVTATGGRPHAETQALQQAGADAHDACLYVTLEPCAHQGKTPPCTSAIIQAGIRMVVTGCGDPYAQVAGKGIAQLREAGIHVIENICADEAREINRGFFSVVERKRPLVSLKLATSLDGKMATGSGESRWITGERARQYGHYLRSRYDAIATGIGTVLADDPLLTCRLPGLEDHSPVRIVFDRELRLPLGSNLVKTAKETPVWVVTAPELLQSEGKTAEFTPASVQFLPLTAQNGINELQNTLQLLAEQGITRLLVEAGGKLSTAFLQSGLVDRMYWFRAPFMIGNDGQAAALHGFPPELARLARWKHVRQVALQPDLLDIFECLPAS